MDDPAVIKVTVDVGLALAKQATGPWQGKQRPTLQLTYPATVEQLVEMLGIPREYIGFVTINGEKKDWASYLEPDDQIMLFPYITGG